MKAEEQKEKLRHAVAELKFELTSLLVESMIEVQEEETKGPGPVCAGRGGEMYSKGKKRRQVLTSQGEIELERSYHYCDRCRSGIFSPGSTTEAWSARVE